MSSCISKSGISGNRTIARTRHPAIPRNQPTCSPSHRSLDLMTISRSREPGRSSSRTPAPLPLVPVAVVAANHSTCHRIVNGSGADSDSRHSMSAATSFAILRSGLAGAMWYLRRLWRPRCQHSQSPWQQPCRRLPAALPAVWLPVDVRLVVLEPLLLFFRLLRAARLIVHRKVLPTRRVKQKNAHTQNLTV